MGKTQASKVQTRARRYRPEPGAGEHKVFALKQFCNLELGFSVDTSHVTLEKENLQE